MQKDNCAVHLGIELGISTDTIRKTMDDFQKDAFGQIHDLLIQWSAWKNTNTMKPTIYRLMVALRRVKANDAFKYLEKTYAVE